MPIYYAFVRKDNGGRESLDEIDRLCCLQSGETYSEDYRSDCYEVTVTALLGYGHKADRLSKPIEDIVREDYRISERFRDFLLSLLTTYDFPV